MYVRMYVCMYISIATQVSFTPIGGAYSEALKQLVLDMLQKEPEARPSASDLYSLRLPQMMAMESEEEEETSEEPPDSTKTKLISVKYIIT